MLTDSPNLSQPINGRHRFGPDVLTPGPTLFPPRGILFGIEGICMGVEEVQTSA